MRLAHQPSTLQFRDDIGVRHRFIPQQAPRIVDQEACGIEHHEHFGDQCLRERLARFARDDGRNLRLALVKRRLEFMHDFNPPPQP